MKSQKNKINKSLYEVHKPSGQISSKITKAGELHQLTPVQFDAMNFICYQAREQFHKKFDGYKNIEKIKDEKSDEELFGFLSNNWFEIDLNELSKFTESYQSDKNKIKLANIIKELKSINVEMGIFKKHDLLVEDVFSLIRRYNKIPKQNKIKIMLEPEILVGWVFKTKPFKQLFLKIQTKLSQTYTKVLYENLKDYENVGLISKPLEQWNHILGFTNKSSKMVSTLKRDYLNRSVKEINEKTDILITDITSRKENGKVTMTIEFKKQSEDRLREIGIVEEDITSNKYYNKSKSKLDKLVKNGYKVIDEDMWIQTDIKKNEDRYDAEVRIDKWLKETDQEVRNDIYKILADSLDDCEDPMVTIEDYTLRGLFSKDNFSKNPQETIDLLNEVIVIISE